VILSQEESCNGGGPTVGGCGILFGAKNGVEDRLGTPPHPEPRVPHREIVHGGFEFLSTAEPLALCSLKQEPRWTELSVPELFKGMIDQSRSASTGAFQYCAVYRSQMSRYGQREQNCRKAQD